MSEARYILERRARALARASVTEQLRATTSHVTFTIAGDIYALSAEDVRQIIPQASVTPLPGARPPLRGVTAWRGEIIRVFDLAGTLTTIGDESKASVIVMGDARPAALIIDQVGDLIDLAAEDIHPLNTQEVRDHVRGVNREAVVVLKAAELIETLG